MVHSDSFVFPFHQNPQNINLAGQGWNVGGYGGLYGQGPGNAQNWNNGYGQQAYGIAGYGPAAFGQAQSYGGPGGWNQSFGGQGWGNQNWGGGWQQRQLSHQDVGEIVRQLVPYLPQVLAQAQQPQAAFGFGNPYGGSFGGSYGPNARNLSPQDVNEVVREILPVIPQIVSLLQGQQSGGYANAIHGGGQNWNNQGWNSQGWNNANLNGVGQQGLFGQNQFGQNQFGHNPQNGFGAFGQAAFGNAQGSSGQRQLNQADVGEIVRQLTAALPQVISNLQNINQQQRAA